MVFQSKENFYLIAILIFVVGGNAAEEKRVQSMPDYDICTLYDHSETIKRVLFQNNYKPLVVIIAGEFNDGINRVRNIAQSKRILHDDVIKNHSSLFKFHKIILENFYLFEAKNVYYFVYPINILNDIFTVYCQKILLNDQLGVVFHFVNVINHSPFYEDILIPLKSGCTNCTLEKYVKRKLQTGESFSELFKLRDRLFGGRKIHLELQAFNNDEICDSIGLNFNSEDYKFLTYFDSSLQQIQNNSSNIDASKRASDVEKSLKCFQSRHLEVTEKIFVTDNTDTCNQKHYKMGFDYLNWINSTISLLSSIDNSFGGICNNDYRIDILKLFCFIKDVSDGTSYNISAWINTLNQLIVKPLTPQLQLFNEFNLLYKEEYFTKYPIFFYQLQNLKTKLYFMNMNESLKWIVNLFVLSLMSERTMCYTSNLISPCSTYKYWKIIDDLLPKMKFKKLIIIVADDMMTGIAKIAHIEGNRIVPKLKREALDYKIQFVHDEIMKHIYLFQSEDTYLYVYPMNTVKKQIAMLNYFEFKMIKDYSKVQFYFVNCSNYFPSIPFNRNGYNDILVPSVPGDCKLLTKCTNCFLNPMHLINLHQEFYSVSSSEYNSFYNKLPEFLLYYYAGYIGYVSECSQQFYDFLDKQSSNKSSYLFKDLPCPSMWTLKKRIKINFNMTRMNHFLYFLNIMDSAYRNITSINDTDNTNLEYFCSNKYIFPLTNLFCFLKMNCIDGMLKFIDKNSLDFIVVKNNIEREKIYISEYLSTTLKWMNRLSMSNYSDYKNNETGIIKELQDIYSSAEPKIYLNNDVDLLNKAYILVREEKVNYECEEQKCLII